MIEVKITGLDELQRVLEEMPKDVARRALRGGLKAGSEIVRQRMVENAPKASGFLSEHFNVKVRIRSNELVGTAHIGPAGKTYYPGKGAKEKGVRTGKHPNKGGLTPVASVARFLEFGTSRMSAKPFLRPAFESTKDSVLSTIINSLRDAIGRWAK